MGNGPAAYPNRLRTLMVSTRRHVPPGSSIRSPSALRALNRPEPAGRGAARRRVFLAEGSAGPR
ncbi:hypothetical protein AQJ11_14170 [Streptomyces corchorusii]|uniref:Uncharacterized protein n=1 Tax=Streptomyces corchorusii TaxID=1903 RepID=A0A117QGX7_STRCK|nr:hypothetical protein AQJ11_14170 [Streptomyces corchorusii]